jgi:glutamate-1-semialdehyde 2,1-aminomutase
MTGFRVALGGAQALYDVTPDLTTLGKVIGGGMPVGAYGGRADIMSVVAPLGGVYQAGTLSGNPVAMTAGLATLELISEAGFYENLASAANRLMDGFESGAARHGIAVTSNRVGGMFGFFFASGTVDSFDAVMNANTDQFNVFFRSMLADGVNLAPSPFESGFVSSAHTNSDLDQTIEAASRAFEKIAAA